MKTVKFADGEIRQVTDHNADQLVLRKQADIVDEDGKVLEKGLEKKEDKQAAKRETK